MQIKWIPYTANTSFESLDADSTTENWDRLHQGDREPCPDDSDVLDAWVDYHNGDFESACSKGIDAGGTGLYAAGKAIMIHAIYLTEKDDDKLAQYQMADELADQLIEHDDSHANGHYLKAFALGRYSQGISIAKALTQGLAGKVRDSLNNVLEFESEHADAHTALGLYHAEIIDKIGSMIGKMTYGASEKEAMTHFARAQEFAPDSAIAKIEYANGLILLKGDRGFDDASDLYVQASEMDAADAMEALDIDMAIEELE